MFGTFKTFAPLAPLSFPHNACIIVCMSACMKTCNTLTLISLSFNQLDSSCVKSTVSMNIYLLIKESLKSYSAMNIYLLIKKV